MSALYAPRPGGQAGFTLLETLIASALGILVIAALAQALVGNKASYQLNSGLATVQENGRFALEALEQHIRMAGYHDKNVITGPLENAVSGVSGGSAAGGSDAITIRLGSGNNTSVTLCDGQPALDNDVITKTFALSIDDVLECTSHSEQADTSITTSLVSGVEQMRIRYGEDNDGDGAANRYVEANVLEDFDAVVAIQVCLVLTSIERTDKAHREYTDCDGDTYTENDGLLRRQVMTTITLRNRV
jgi:type IV pilus assembly protein PilW